MNQLALNPVSNNEPPGKLLKKVRALQNRGQYRDSLKLCQRLTDQGYAGAELYHFHGLALRACDDPETALVKLYAALELKPEDARIYNSLGAVFLQMKEVEMSIEMFKRATNIDKKYYNAWKNLGIALRSAERFQAAVIALTCAHHLDRKEIEPLLNIVYIYIDVRQYKLAEEAMDQLLAACGTVTPDLMLKRMLIAVRLEDLDFIKEHYPKFDLTKLNKEERAEADHAWSYYLASVGRYDEAISLLEDCAKRDTASRKAFMSHLGLCYAETGRNDDAISLHETLLKEYPDFVEGRYNLAFLQFKNGDLENGYKNFEARWQWREFPTKRRQFDAPQWDGQSLTGKKLLVWREQGIGDEVRYASLLQDLETSGADITFECSPKLESLWGASFPWLRVQPEGQLNCINDADYKDFDFQVPVGSLASTLRPTVQSYSDLQMPWIKRNPADEEQVRALLNVGSDQLLVGLCWRSSNRLASRDKYFLNCEQLQGFAAFENTRWLNVQYDVDEEELKTFRDLGLQMHHFTDIDQKDDLVSACNLLGACDLVITIGGSVADLAGGLGVPMIYMTAENSEVFLGTDHVPWFRNCKSYPIKPFQGPETVSKIIADWQEISDWATGLRNHKSPAISGPVGKLDLRYNAS